MKKIFEDKKEPLFGRTNNKIHLKSFTVDALKKILEENYPMYANKDLLSFYILTGGVTKYVEIFVEKKAFSFEQQIDIIFDDFSLFLEEGKNLLIEKLENDYTLIRKVKPILQKREAVLLNMKSLITILIFGSGLFINIEVQLK